jgi:hypothetical protein
MRKLLQTLAISALLLAPASTAHAQVSVGIRIGEPPAPRAYRVPGQPGPDYVWVEDERTLFCPLTSILAVSYGRASGKKSN